VATSLEYSYLMKREARFADDARPSASPRGERAQDGKSVCLIFVCEIRLDRLTVLNIVEPSTPLRLDPERGRGVEGRNTLHERRLELAAEVFMNHEG
jgi:hypothetical protein